jgi:hypothetical protein
MSWLEKGKSFSFENDPIPGLHFLDGDILAANIGKDWTRGLKYPVVLFPSGLVCDLWEGDKDSPIVHIFGELDLSFRSTRDDAFQVVNDIAEAVGYAARKVGEDGIEVWGHEEDEHVLIRYDDQEAWIADIVPLKTDEKRPPHPAHVLMPDEVRHKLPPLYANEKIGLDAVAQVKYFTPDGMWSWYGSEYDGEDVLFGLVAGFEVELGYFSLSELREVRGSLGLPVERDLHYEPKTLRELEELHTRMRSA